MSQSIGRFTRTLLSLSVFAVLTACGGPPVTQNPEPTPAGGSSTQPGNGGVTPPGGSNPGTTTPPPANGAVGDLTVAVAKAGALSTTPSTVYNLNTAALSAAGWRSAELLEHNDYAGATSPRVAFDTFGNGFAVWALGNDVFVSRYLASSASWSSPLALDEGIDVVHQARIAVDRATGNAVATWTQSDGVAESIYASRFDAGTQSWSAPQMLEDSDGAVDLDSGALAASIAGSHAAVAWRQHDGAAMSVYLSRFESGSWTAPALIDVTNQDAQDPDVAIDSNGNASVVWRQFDASQGQTRIHARRWDNSVQALGGILQLNNNGDLTPRLKFDAQGNGILLWRGDGVFARRFDASSGQWGSQVTIHNNFSDVRAAELAVDTAGNAMAVWVERYDGVNSLYARRYNAAAGIWGNSELLETSDVPVSTEQAPTVSLSGTEAVVAWIQDTSAQDVYSVKLSKGAWGPATQLDIRSEAGSQLTSSVTASGNAAVLWVQFDDAARSIYQARYLASNVIVPAGGTWQSLANLLYGVDSVEAGTAFQAAMGGGTLTEGTSLSGFPATLTVTTTVPAYYTVLATDTWSHIAQTVYGISDVAAITQLQTLLGNPELTAGLRLIVPSTLEYRTSANYSAPLDWSRVDSTITTTQQLNAALLTVPLQSWSTAAALEARNENASSPRIAFDAKGNGIAVWVQANDIVMRRYVASSAQWSAPAILDNNPDAAANPRVAIDRVTGNALVAWTQSDGVAPSLYVSSFDASNDNWSVPQLIESSGTDVTLSSGVALSGEYAAVTWLQSNGTLQSDGTPIADVYLSRLVGGTWSTPALIDSGSNRAESSDVAIDRDGNVTLAWRQLDDAGTENIIYTRRWNNATSTLGSVLRMNTAGGDRQARLRFDATGNGMLLWSGAPGEGVFVRRFDAVVGEWGPQLALHTAAGVASNGELSVDASGDALATWTEMRDGVSAIYARHYDASTAAWEAATEIANNFTAADMTVSLVNDSGVVAWVTAGDDHNDLYAARLQDDVWGAPTLLETRNSRPMEIASALDSNNNASVLWVQGDDMAFSIFQASSNSSSYYLVPAASDWRSIAATLYGVDSDAAGQALATALSQPSLTTGLQLKNLPALLALTSSSPTHYVVQSGDTWQSITLALYGTNRSEAVTALWDLLGRPALTVGQQLMVPSELPYTIED